MHDCVPLGTGNSRSLKSSISAGTTWEQALAMLRAGTFPIDLGKINEEGVAQKGDPLNQETLLKTAVAALYGKDGSAVPSDIFQILSKAALYENGIIKDVLGGSVFKPGNCEFYTTSYVGTGSMSLPSTLSLTFPWLPEFMFTYKPNSESEITLTIPKVEIAIDIKYTGVYYGGDVSYSGTTVSWVVSGGINLTGNTFNVIAFGKAQ